MVDTLTLLQDLGFSEHEARAYQALLQHHPVSGYELAKVSNIPRPNIYPVLQKLEARGAAVRIAGEADETARYHPVPPEELLERIGHHFQATVNQAAPALQQLARPAATDYIWQMQGRTNLLAQARTLIRKAQMGLLIALWPDEARALADDLAQAEARQVAVTTLCLAACPEECGACRGRIFRNRVVESSESRWLLLTADSQEVLAAEIPAAGQGAGVRTRQGLLVKMTSWFIQHAITLGVLLQGSGEEVASRLTPEARAALADVDSRGEQNWLANMHQLLNSSGGRTDVN